MTIWKCKMCGGNLKLAAGVSTVECEYCGSVQTVPKTDDEKKLIQFERAERLRKQCEFDKAAGIYESIIADFREEAEAYWGLVLCKYGIEYVDDPATGKKVPTCHRSSFDSVLESNDFELTLENADVIARKIYREEAKRIEELRKGIIQASASEEPYDIFISYKETDDKGNRTLDSVLAQDVYDALTDKGYRVFFSRISLEEKLGQEYEPCIFAALNSAKIMLVFGTDYEHFNAVWVKNEWGRYLKLMETDRDKHLIPCFKNVDAYDLPKEFARLQAQDLSKVGATQDLLRGIGKILPLQEVAEPSDRQKSSAKPTKSLWAESRRRDLLSVAGVAHLLMALIGLVVFIQLGPADYLDRAFREALFWNHDTFMGLATVAAWCFGAFLMFLGLAKKLPEKYFLLPLGLYTFTMLIPLSSVGPRYLDVAIIYAPNFLAGCLSLAFIILRTAKDTPVTAFLRKAAKVCLILGCALAGLTLVSGSLPFICINIMLLVPIMTSFAMWQKA